MPRILVAECKQEVSSFNPVRSRYTDFVVTRGKDIVDFHEGLNTEMRGALDVFHSRTDIELAPTYSALSITSKQNVISPLTMGSGQDTVPCAGYWIFSIRNGM